jgi:hypothetical protein
MSERREEAYKAGKAYWTRSFRTFGHNKLCPYKKCDVMPNLFSFAIALTFHYIYCANIGCGSAV